MKKHFLISMITTLLVVMIISFLFTACKEKNSPSDPTAPTNTTTTESTGYKINTYIEPCLDWGKSYQWVSNIMANKGFVIDQLTTSLTGKYVLVSYFPRRKESFTILGFDTNNTYQYAMIYIYKTVQITTELDYFMNERYNFIKFFQNGGVNEILYRTKDGKTDVEVYEEYDNGKNYWVVCYTAKS